MTSSTSGTGSTGWQSTQGPKQQLTGLASGMDTQGIVTQLMAIEKQSYDKLEVKKQTEQLRLQAYQAVNSMLLKFKSSITNLSSQKLWNSKLATSSNETSLKATASQYAVNGTYSFRVTQTASQAEYTSKGFSDTKESFGKADANGKYETLGTISTTSAKSRVDDSAKLESLNGGKGVFRGSIRITDARGGSGTVDLSGCETVSDVVNAINNGSGFQVKASIGRKDGESFIQLNDDTGGTGFLKVQDVGLGTTAKDLGLNVDAVSGSGVQTLSGRNVYYLGRDSDLSLLNDGLGVEMGNEQSKLRIYLAETDSKMTGIDVDLSRAKTVGDVMDAVNKTLSEYVGFEKVTLGLNAARNGFEFTGLEAGDTLSVFNTWQFPDSEKGQLAANPQIAEQLGLAGTYMGDASGVNTANRLLGDVDSPLLSNLSGATGKGIGSAQDNKVSVKFNKDTNISSLNGGNGLTIGNGLWITINEGNGYDGRNGRLGDSFNLLNNADIQDIIKRDGTVEELVDAINASIADAAKNLNAKAFEGVTVEIGENGLYWKGVSSAYTFEVGGSTADQLGLSRIYGELGGSASDLPNELKELLGSKDLRAKDMEGFEPNAKVEDLQAVGATQTIKEAGGLANYLSGSTGNFVVNVNGKAYDLQDGITAFLARDADEQTIENLMTDLDDDLADQVHNGGSGHAAEPGATVPYLYFRQDGKQFSGLVWSNVDFGSSFEVTGGLADALGLNRDYTPPGTPMPDLEDEVMMDLNPMNTGYLEYHEIDGTNATTLKLSDMNHGKGLSLKGEDSDTLTLTFTPGKDSSNSPVTLSLTKLEIETRLKKYMAEIANNGGTPPTGTPPFDDTGWESQDPHEATLEQYLDVVNSLIKDKIDNDSALGVDANFVIGTNQAGLFIKNAYGNEAGETIQLGGELVMNGTWGLGNTPVVSKAKDTNFTDSQLSFLLPATVHEKPISGLGNFTMQIGGNTVEIRTKGLDDISTPRFDDGYELTQESSMREMMEYFNKQLLEAGVTDVKFTLNTAGTGLALDNSGNKNVVVKNAETYDHLASDLGLLNADGTDKTYSSYSVTDGLSIGRRFIDRSTTLKDLAGAKTLELTSLNITNTLGSTMQIDVSNCLSVGDVVDAINMYQGFGVRAQVNATGDGLDLYEYWEPDNVPADDKRVTNIKVAEEGSGNLASLLGIDKTGEGFVQGLPYGQRSSSLSGSVKKTITITGSDTLESLMNRMSELGYKTAIIDDGSGPNSKRLKIMSTSTGAVNDFVLDCDLAFLGLTQTSRAKDAKVLSGDPSSGTSPMMLSSATNTNSKAIPGLTLEIKEASEKYTTITVDTDKTKVADEIKNMVQTYNDLNDFIAYLDGIDPESYEKGVLFGDTSVRSMMESIDDMFYLVYNPDGYGYGEKSEKTAWTWMDLGISFDVNQTNQATGVTGSGWYSTMTFDEEVLNEMVASNWDNLYNTLASQRNASNSKLSQRVAAQATFSFKTVYDKDGNPIEQVRNDPHGAINNDYGTSYDNGNGFVANNTIAQGENEYTIFFQGNIDASRIDIYHGDADTALSDFIIEYLDPTTGKWEEFRKIEGNTSSSNVGLTFVPPREIQALRITASKTNASDGKFRLLDVQVLEDTGLAGKLNKLTSSLGDVTTGWLAERNEDIESTITDLNDQMSRQAERLEAKEASLWRQFTAMEVAMSKLQNQSSQLSGLLSSLSSS